MQQQENNIHQSSESEEVNHQQNNLDQKLQECQLQLQDWKDRFMRIGADFENYKRRQEKERQQITLFAQAIVLKDLLDIVDNFERALTEHQKDIDAEKKSWLQGFELIYKDLKKYLEKVGVQEIKEISTFNPELHESVMSVASDQHQSGHIVQVLQKGYRLKDQILRPAKVSIAQ